MAWNAGNGFRFLGWNSWHSGNQNGSGYIPGGEDQQDAGGDEMQVSPIGNGGMYINPAFTAPATNFTAWQDQQMLWIYQQQSQLMEQMQQMGYLGMGDGNGNGLNDPLAMQQIGLQYPLGNATYQAQVNNVYQNSPTQTVLNPRARGWVPTPTVTRAQAAKQELTQEAPAEFAACTLDELIAQSLKAATSTKPKQTSPLPESTPKAPKAMLGFSQGTPTEGTPTKGPAVARRDQQPHGTIICLKTSSKPCVSSGPSSSQSSEIKATSTKPDERDKTAKPELRCYNCGKVDSHATMYCTNGCGHCGENGHQTIRCSTIRKQDKNEMMHKNTKAVIDKEENDTRAVKDGKKDVGRRDNTKCLIKLELDSVGYGNGDTKRRPESGYYRGEYGNAGVRRERLPGKSQWSPRDKYSRDHGDGDAMHRKDTDRKDSQYRRLRSLSPPKESAFKRGRKDSWRGPAWR